MFKYFGSVNYKMLTLGNTFQLTVGLFYLCLGS